MPSTESHNGVERTIARGITAIYKDYLGRGPTSTRTRLLDDCVVTTLGQSLTKAEESLVEAGDTELVRLMRQKFQLAMREDIARCVESATGRKCAAFLSDHDTDHDVAVEMVLFEQPK
jgi:uncharacterized protein YbcI